MSNAYGYKKVQALEEESSGQSFQTGFDSGILKNNSKEEIILRRIQLAFKPFKYIKIVIRPDAIQLSN